METSQGIPARSMTPRTPLVNRRRGARAAALLGAVVAAAGAVVATQVPAYASTCTTSAASGSCGPYNYSMITSSNGSSTYVNNNVWSPVSGWSETLTASSPGSWSVVAKMPAGNTAIVSYPDVQQLYNDTPLSKFSSLTSSFSETMNAHSGTSSEAAYDLWLNNWNYEVMIWNDAYGQDPSYDTHLASVAIGGQDFEVYRNGGGGPGEELIVSRKGNVETGAVDILATLKWLQGKGYLPSGATLTSIDYGWEIASTGGQSETYQLSSFCINENGATKCPGEGSAPPPSSSPSSPTQPSSSPSTTPPTRDPSSPASPPSSPSSTPPAHSTPTPSPTRTTPSPSPSSSPPSQTAPPRPPLWYWLVTRIWRDSDILLPAPSQHQGRMSQLGRHHHRRPGGGGFPGNINLGI